MTQLASPILRHLSRMVEDRQVKNLADADLIQRYLLRGDQAAFQALVRRHGEMVLGVCRCLLANESDVEDAFQTTFLVLIRKARSIRKRRSVSSWLYGVAHRTCLKVQAASARRRKHEAQVPRIAEPARADAVVTWPEVQRLLYVELNQLAERHRAPLVLCYLQGKTQDEAATELGLAKTVLRGRLERGRSQLRERLRRRGLGPAALLVVSAWPAGAASAAVPHALLSATVASAGLLATGSQALPASIAVLVEGVVKSMMLTKLKFAASTLLAAFLIGAFAVLWTWHAGAAAGFAQGDNPRGEVALAAADDDAKPASESPGVLVAGIVVDRDGKAVAGAELELKKWQTSARAISQRDGTFQMKLDHAPKFGFTVLARSPDGEQAAYLGVGEPEAKEDWKALRLVLKPARRVEVTVTDAKGQPLAGARAGVLSEMTIVAQALSDAQGRAMLRVPSDCAIEQVYAWRHGAGFDYRSFLKPRGSSDLLAKAPVVPPTIPLQLQGTRTFRTTAVDPERRPIAKMPLYLWYLNKPGEPSDINLSGAREEFGMLTDERGSAVWDWLPAWQEQTVTFWPITKDYAHRRFAWEPKDDAGAATFVLERLELVRGRVTHADGSPAKGIRIRAGGDGYDFDTHHGETKTDADGKYELRLPPYQLYLLAVDDKNWAAEPQTGFAVLPKTPIANKDFTLRPATIIQGRLTLGKEQKPYAGQYLFLIQKGADNITLPNALPNPENSRRYVEPTISQNLQTDANGRFEFRVGPGQYWLRGPDQIKPVAVTVADEAQLEFNLNAPRPGTGRLTGLIVAGTPPMPVANAVIAGIYRSPLVSVGDVAAKTNAEGRFDVQRQQHRIVLHARSADRQLAGVVEIGPDDATVTIPLARVATARGRLVDGDTGEPLADRVILCGVRVPIGDEANAPFRTDFGGKATTDSAGNFELKGLVAGQKYSVDVVIENDRSWRAVHTLQPSPGESLKLGDIKLAPERKPPTAAEQRRAVFEAKGTPVQRFEAAQRDARLSHQRVLVIFAAPNDAAAEQLFALSRDRDELRERLDDFRTLWVSTEGGRLPAAQALANKLKLELRAGAAPVLVVAGERGEKLAIQDTAGLRKDAKLDGAALRQFLQREAPERLDAEKLLADALARAKQENKRVLVQETATWCGPCWRLSRFLDANRELWEKDYLWIKLDHRWDHASDVAKRLKKGIAQGGIPWTAILDADGKVLATSNAKDGQNVGFPSDAAAITHFETMLRTTALRLTPPEIARLSEALKKASAP